MKKSLGIALRVMGMLAISGSVLWGATSNWIGVQDSTFGVSANWDNGTPGGGDTGVFTSSAPFAVNILTNTSVGGLTFAAGASAYAITVGSTTTVNITGAGIDNRSSVAQNVTVAAGGIMQFQNSAGASSATITTNLVLGSAIGNLDFIGFSTADHATIVNNGRTVFTENTKAGSANITNNGTNLDFYLNASAENATITNNNGVVVFYGVSSSNAGANAGNSTVQNSGSGSVEFMERSTAGNAAITNNGGGTIQFEGFDTDAGHATLTNNGGGAIQFYNSAKGGAATLTNIGLGTIQFNDDSTAGNATLTNNGGGTIQFNANSNADSATINSTLGTTNFTNTSNAEDCVIANAGGAANFTDTATAGNALITNSAGGSLSFSTAATAGQAVINNNDSSLTFFGASNGGNSAITNNGASSLVQFNNTSNAGNATITNRGGLIQFNNLAQGGDVAVVNTSGTVDVSNVASSRLTLGSIAGGGSFTLGSTSLSVGDNGLSTTVSGVISGSGGSLVKVGSGTLTLSGVNTYTNGTTVNAGTLSIANDNNLGGAAGTLALSNNTTLQTLSGITSARTITLDGSATVDTKGQDSTLSGAIGGGGSLVKVGTGTLTLSGNDTYGGSTMVNAGTLRTGAANVLPSGTTVIVADSAGARLDLSGYNQTIGALQGGGGSGGEVALGTATLTLGAGNASSDFGGVISGSGTLVKVGAGTLTLSGDTLNTGGTTVLGGVLNMTGTSKGDITVNSQATFSKSGEMGALVNNGKVIPGNNGVGSLKVAKYSGSGALNFVFAGASHNSLEVAGTATLTGGSLLIGGSQFKSGRYDVLTASSVVGTFAQVDTPPSTSFLQVSTVYSPTDVEILINAMRFSDFARTGNQGKLAAALDRAQSNATTDFAAAYQALLALTSPAEIQSAYNQISGDSLASFQGAGLHSAGVFAQQMNDRTAPPDFAKIASLMAPIQVAYAGDLTHLDLGEPEEPKNPTPAPAYGFWSRGLGFKDDVDANASVGSPASHTTTGGFQVGYDIPIDENLLIGLSGGYAKTGLTVDDRSSSGNTTSVQSGVYAKYGVGAWFVNGSLAYTTASNEMTRPINFPGFSEQATASFQSRVYSSHLETGYTFKPHKGFTFEPSVSLQQSHFQQESFTESGAPGLDLSVGEQHVDSLVSAVGGRVIRHFRAERAHPLSIGARAAWQHELASIDNTLTADFAEAPGNPFTVQGTPRDRNAAALGLDGQIGLYKDLQAFFDYSTTLSAGDTTQGITGGLSVKW